MTARTKQMPAGTASDVQPTVAPAAAIVAESTVGKQPVADQASSGPATAGSIGIESDEALALRLRAGDSAAGDELVTRYHPALIRYLHRLGGSDHMAEELHQQTWLSVLDHIDRFDPASSAGGFKAWLFRIATNKTNDHWRSRGRERSATEGLKLVTDEELPASSDRLESTQEQEKLKTAIQKLPDAQRQVLMLRYYSNMKFVDIAQMLGCPLNTALGRMHKAVQKLRVLMEQ
jgi:RNA polymerase sigma-70 factor (ECF subfamily)